MSRKATSKTITPKLIVLSAPSGTGKSTIASLLMSRHPNIKLSISYTTRPPRGEEKHGIHYFFTSELSFQSMIQGGEFLEHAHVFGKYWYGTSKSAVEASLAAGHSVLFDIDVQGASNLKKMYGDKCVTIFLLPPSFAELESRLRKRKTDSPEAIEIRLNTAKEEIKTSPTFDYQIVNSEVEKTFEAIEQILVKEGCI